MGKAFLFLLLSLIIGTPVAFGYKQPSTTTGGSTTGSATGGSGSSTAGSATGAEGSGANTGMNVMIGSAIAKNLASLAFDAEDTQKVAGTIDIATGGYLIKINCPPPPKNILLCIYGISAIANGAASLKSSKKSRKAGEGLGGGGSTSKSKGDYFCNPFIDPSCRVAHCNSHPSSPICRCPDGTPRPSSGVCSGGSTDNGSTNPSGGCSDGSTCPPSGFCSDGSTCNPFGGEISCYEDPNQEKCRVKNPNPLDDLSNICRDHTGSTCEEAKKNACLELSPQCRIIPPNDDLEFYDQDGNPIKDSSLRGVGKRLGLTPEEIQDVEDKIQKAQQKARNQIGGSSGSKSRLKGHGDFFSDEEQVLPENLSNEFEPSLTNGGGKSFVNNRGSQRKGRSSNFSKQLKAMLDRQKNNHRSSVKKHGYKPLKLGNQPIGTSHDNIFDMVSRGYQGRESSFNAR